MRWIVLSLIALNVLIFLYFKVLTIPTDNSSHRESDDNLPAGIEIVRLLSETKVDKNVSMPVNNPVGSEGALGSKPSAPLCTIVGPFEKLLQAEYFVERLRALDVVAKLGEMVVASKTVYWLHLSPEPSRKEAVRRLSELQRRGVDSYVIPSGELRNGISLGVFSNRDSALKLQKKILAQGYLPKIMEVAREQKEIWVLLSPGEAAKLAPERWARLMVSDQYLQKRKNFCADVASI